ncbi:MAG TPA: SprT family zinc-dependent metalloprotease [Syntrophales bacterium]|jgi:hypothetical protein|nr:SprT family zinc-dependent metalloprotease [Syntrophales bacterium]HOU76898.1 SprT family zinc-dependent metalloprotease [Syntrophales bacterium]HPC31667.1 SprT family zinc-dependent metalloprotease [Syntrophales bacterium]HQG34278.1 SprT family zinc-dependent metalloprotease [Syntrophales bacterium]HRU87820.1 SprT family zinc-dependent metalloprotease [Syntrophales bacterium]
MDLTYELIRSAKRRKTMSLVVMPGGVIVIRAPRHVPSGEVDGFFRRKRPWIEKKLADLEGRRATWGTDGRGGGRVLFLGVSYPVVVRDVDGPAGGLSFDGIRFLLAPGAGDGRREMLQAWYCGQAASFLPGRVKYFEELWGCRSRSVRISKARSRWGSCSADNRLAFSWRLMMAPPAVIDYVVVHELAHLREKNHSPRFWALVGEMCPDYRQLRRRLNTLGTGALL